MKLRFKNVLVVQNSASSSVRAVDMALSLIHEKGGTIKVVDVVKNPTWIWKELAGEQQLADAKQSQLQHLREVISTVGVGEQVIDVDLLSGRPITEILKLVEAGQYDIVIKDAVAETAEFFFGSLDMRLLRYCQVPVLLTRPNFQGSFKTILAAVDPESDPERATLNHEIIRQASAFARLNAAELHVVSTWYSPAFNFDLSEETVRSYDRLTERVQRHSRDNLDAILDQSLQSVDPQRIHFGCNEPGDFIIDVAKKIQPDLLVMGSQARLSVPGVFIGNTAEKVLRHVDCAVMTMKPIGFKSPVLDSTRPIA